MIVGEGDGEGTVVARGATVAVEEVVALAVGFGSGAPVAGVNGVAVATTALTGPPAAVVLVTLAVAMGGGAVGFSARETTWRQPLAKKNVQSAMIGK